MGSPRKNYQRLISGNCAKDAYDDKVVKEHPSLSTLGRDCLLLAYAGTYGNIYVGKSYTKLMNPVEPVIDFKATAVFLPNTVTYIGDRVFKGCKYLKFMIIPKNVKYIGAQAFSGCNLNFIAMKPEFKDITIDKKAFDNCLLRRVIIFKEDEANKWGELFSKRLGYTPSIEDKGNNILIKSSIRIKELSEDKGYRERSNNMQIRKGKLPFELAYYKYIKEHHSPLYDDIDVNTRRENDMKIWEIERGGKVEEVKSEDKSKLFQPSLPFDKKEVPYLYDDEKSKDGKDPQPDLPFDKCL